MSELGPDIEFGDDIPFGPEDGGELLDALVTFLRRYVVMSDAQAAVIALWVLHSYAIEAADTTPYLHVTAPTKRAGKSRLLEVLEVLVRKPLKAGGATEAALFRGIADRAPTLLFDEITRCSARRPATTKISALC